MNGEMFWTCVLSALLALLFLLIIILFLHLRALARRYKTFMTASDGFSLEKALWDLQSELAFLREELQKNRQVLADLQQKMQRALQAVGFVRFNAFSNTGGELSFSLAVLDGEAGGVVLSSIYGREESKIYAKPVSGGKPSYALSGEEEEAIRKAMLLLQGKTGIGGAAGR
ncbi:MAG: DUF4446 family protein [Firmicutes bacterium]|nr:DUF4446 family protein [Bacillota bacterium]